MTPRACVYMLAKLRKAAHRLTNDTDEEEYIRRGVICLVAYTVELGREVLSSAPLPVAGWLLLRTLWHNTGCLAWLLHGPGEIGLRIGQLANDEAIRAKQALLDEPTRVLGKKGADALLSGSDHDRATLQEAAAEALSKSKSPGRRGDWGNIGVDKLQQALFVAVKTAAEHLPDNDSKTELHTILQDAEIARERGDDFAHPNPFTILTRLNLVDDAVFLIRKRGLAHDITNDPEFRTTVASFLLLLQVCAIAAYDANAISLTKIMKIGAREAASLSM